MTVDALETSLKNEELKPIYLLYGEETYILENCVNKIKKKFGEKIEGINYITLDDETVQALISEIDTPAFGFEKKLIIVKKAEIFKRGSKAKNIQEKLNDYIRTHFSSIKANVVLVFIEEKIDKLKITATIENFGITCNFEKLTPSQIVKRLKHVCDLYKVKVEEKDLMYLTDIVGTSMQNLMNEIRKLIEFVGDNGTITKNDIEMLCIPQIDSVIFNLTDELGSKKINEAIVTLNNLLYQKEPIQMILIMLYRHFKKLYLVKLAKTENRDVKEVLELKANQIFLVTKYKNQAEYFTETKLRDIMKELLELDQKSKQGLIDLEVGVEAFLCNVV